MNLYQFGFIWAFQQWTEEFLSHLTLEESMHEELFEQKKKFEK